MQGASKQFTATAILLLKHDGRLHLDDPVQRWLPALPQSNITLRQLLTHTSGLLDERLRRAGFGIVRLTYTNFSLLPPLLLVRALQRRRGLRPEATAHQEITVPAAPVNAVLTGLVLAESVWIRWFDSPAGSSLLCLAQKPA